MPSPTSAACAKPIEKSPARRPRTCSAKGTSHKRISISGSSARQRARKADSRESIAPSDIAMRRLPRKPAAIALALSCACSRIMNSRRMSCRKAAPAGVKRVPRLSRSKKTTPNSSSSSLIARDKGGCSMCSRSAARVKCSSSAKATKHRRCRNSICSAFLVADANSLRCHPSLDYRLSLALASRLTQLFACSYSWTIACMPPIAKWKRCSTTVAGGI